MDRKREIERDKQLKKEEYGQKERDRERYKQLKKLLTRTVIA